jgi:hypothetical protein
MEQGGFAAVNLKDIYHNMLGEQYKISDASALKQRRNCRDQKDH